MCVTSGGLGVTNCNKMAITPQWVECISHQFQSAILGAAVTQLSGVLVAGYVALHCECILHVCVLL